MSTSDSDPPRECSGRGPWPHDDVVHAWWLEPGSILAGEYPGAPERLRAAARLDLLIDAAGVRTFVDLTAPEDGLPAYAPYLTEAGRVRGLELRYVPHPIPDFGVISDAGYDAILATLDAAAQHGAVYLHCWGGIGRTGTVAACYLVARGASPDGAVARLAELRAGTRTAHRASPETPAQLALVRARATTAG